MDLDQATSSDGSPGSTDHEGEGDDLVQFEMDASIDHTEHQFNDSGLSASSGGSYAAHRSHDSLAEDEALSREEGTKIVSSPVPPVRGSADETSTKKRYLIYTCRVNYIFLCTLKVCS